MPPGVLVPAVDHHHDPPSSLVPHCPCLRPPPVLPCGKFLEARPSSKFSARGTPWWSCSTEHHLPAPISL